MAKRTENDVRMIVNLVKYLDVDKPYKEAVELPRGGRIPNPEFIQQLTEVLRNQEI